MEPKSRARPWQPSRIVSLLTDFGLDDAYVGEMKGVILARCAAARPVDLCHGVRPQALLQAAWILRHAWRRFPPGSVHVAVVDPGVGSERRCLAAEEDGHAFLAPDNGLLGPVLSDAARVFELDVERFAAAERGATFHGRDVFAPAAAALAGGLAPEEAGRPIADWRRLTLPPVEARGPGSLSTEVLFADRFGNLITPLDAGLLAGGAGAWTVAIGEREIALRRTYADAAPGEALALIGSCDSLEIAVRDGDAARELGAGPGTPVEVRRR